MESPAIQLKGVHKQFGRSVEALRGLDLQVPAGSVYGLIGRNGVGKTTALRCAMGLLRPDSGTALVLGHHMLTAPAAHRARVAYVSQASQLHPSMTLEELCRYLSYFYPSWDGAYATSLARRFELSFDRAISQMSGGEQRKAAMVLAFAARTELVILDEPAAGLDPVARAQFLDTIIETVSENDHRTVLISSHIIADLERVADHIGIMQPGKMMWQAPLTQLQERVRMIQVIFPGDRVPAGFVIPGAIKQTTQGPVLNAVVHTGDNSSLEQLRTQRDVRVTEFPVPLEELFVELLGPANSEFWISPSEVQV